MGFFYFLNTTTLLPSKPWRVIVLAKYSIWARYTPNHSIPILCQSHAIPKVINLLWSTKINQNINLLGIYCSIPGTISKYIFLFLCYVEYFYNNPNFYQHNLIYTMMDEHKTCSLHKYIYIKAPYNLNFHQNFDKFSSVTWINSTT